MDTEKLLLLTYILTITCYLGYHWFALGIILFTYLICMESDLTESFGQYWRNDLNYNWQVGNRNAFRNYYRNGFRLSGDLGWKPSMSWSHLEPYNNECGDRCENLVKQDPEGEIPCEIKNI